MEHDDIKAIKCAVCVMGSKKFVLTIMGRESKCWAGEWFTVSELIESPAPCATARPLRDLAAPPPSTTAAGRQSHKEYDRAAAAVVAMVARAVWTTTAVESGRAGGDGRTDERRRRRSKRHTGRLCVGQRSDDDDDDDYDGGGGYDDTRTPRAPPRHTSRPPARAHTDQRVHTYVMRAVLVYRPRAHCACPARRRRLTSYYDVSAPRRRPAEREVNKVTAAVVIFDARA